jgi:hypothetical protein
MLKPINENIKLCFIGNSHVDMFSHSNIFPNTITKKCIGASIKGLVNENSTLQLKNQIFEFQNDKSFEDYTLVFFLGQVDIEFGYYYKCCVDKIKYDFQEYCDNLISRYEYFFTSNVLKLPFIILGINPTVIKNNEHIFNVCFRCDNGKSGFYSGADNKLKFNDVKNEYIYHDYDTRLKHNKIFNEKLEAMCNKNGFKYIDFWEYLFENNKRHNINSTNINSTNIDNYKLKESYDPKRDNDHHLKTDNGELMVYVINKITQEV